MMIKASQLYTKQIFKIKRASRTSTTSGVAYLHRCV